LALSDLTLDDLEVSNVKVTIFHLKFIESGEWYDVGLSEGQAAHVV